MSRSNIKIKPNYDIYADDFIEVPSEYIPVEYIEFTGTQYISLNTVISTAYFTFYVTYQCTTSSSTTHQPIFSSRSSATTGAAFWTDGYCQYGSVNGGTQVSGVSAVGKHSIIFKRGYLTYDDVGPTAFSYGGTTLGSGVLFLGMDPVNTNTYFTGRIYALKIEKTAAYDNNIVEYLIPVKRVSDNKPGFYSTIDGLFKTNSGSGTDFLLPDENFTNAYPFVKNSDYKVIGSSITESSSATNINYNSSTKAVTCRECFETPEHRITFNTSYSNTPTTILSSTNPSLNWTISIANGTIYGDFAEGTNLGTVTITVGEYSKTINLGKVRK